MYKILILAYLITQDPIATQQTFQMQRTFDSMEDCKKELLLQTRDNGTYDVLWEFVNDNLSSVSATTDSETDLLLTPTLSPMSLIAVCSVAAVQPGLSIVISTLPDAALSIR